MPSQARVYAVKNLHIFSSQNDAASRMSGAVFYGTVEGDNLEMLYGVVVSEEDE